MKKKMLMACLAVAGVLGGVHLTQPAPVDASIKEEYYDPFYSVSHCGGRCNETFCCGGEPV